MDPFDGRNILSIFVSIVEDPSTSTKVDNASRRIIIKIDVFLNSMRKHQHHHLTCKVRKFSCSYRVIYDGSSRTFEIREFILTSLSYIQFYYDCFPHVQLPVKSLFYVLFRISIAHNSEHPHLQSKSLQNVITASRLHSILPMMCLLHPTIIPSRVIIPIPRLPTSTVTRTATTT